MGKVRNVEKKYNRRKTKTHCDECGEAFNVKPRVKKHPGKVEELYFKCPHCGKRYTSAVTDDMVRAMQKQYAVVQGEITKTAAQFINNEISCTEYDVLEEELTNEQERIYKNIKERMTLLKKQIQEARE